MTPSFSAAAEENRAIPDLGALAAATLTGGDLLNGPEVRRFETYVAASAGRAHAVAVGSGTDALFFALVASGIGPGDEVLVPAFSFVATAGAVVRTGARALFVDVLDADDPQAPFTLDLEQARASVSPVTKAVVWIGLFGGWRDPAPVEAFAAEHGLVLIEDAAQSFGASFKDRPAGSMGMAAAFSFDRQKVLGAPGTGGALVTDDDAMAARARRLRWHGLDQGVVEQLGYNSQMSEFSAGVLNAKAALLPEWLAARRRVAALYDTCLAGLPLAVPRWAEGTVHARHKYVLASEDRAGLERHLEAASVPVRRHYDLPLTAHPAFGGGKAPVAARLAERSLSLPIHPFLSDADADRVAAAVRSFFA